MHFRKVVEHAVLYELKANVGDIVKENMVQGFADLKEDCSKWVGLSAMAEIYPLVAFDSIMKSNSLNLINGVGN